MTFKRKKITIIGAGFTGRTTAFLLSESGLADIVLLDIPELENPVKGAALDMLEATPIFGADVLVQGTSDYAKSSDSDLVIITAGIARKPGMSRDDLLAVNSRIIRNVTKEAVKYSPLSTIIVLSNPVDVMTYLVYKESGFPKNRVIGQSGVLDTARFRMFVAQELNVSVKDVTAFVLGGHGDDMLPLVRYSHVGGIPLANLLPKTKIDELIDRTRKGGGEIVNLLGSGSAYFAPGAALTEMAEAVLLDKRRVLPVIAYLDGEFGYSDVCAGVPVILGGNGIEQIIELILNEDETALFDQSVASVKKIIAKL